jgi:hypothetical protein
MDPKTLQSLRPRDTTSDGIASAIERMESALIELRGELAAIEGARRGILLSGSNGDIDKHDSRIRSVGLDIERIEAQIEALRPDLSLARGQEKLSRIESLRTEADLAIERANKFWLERYEALAKEIAEGVGLFVEARRAQGKYNQAASDRANDPDVRAAGGAPSSHQGRLPYAFVGNFDQQAPELLICLPAVTPGHPIYWPNRRV